MPLFGAHMSIAGGCQNAVKKAVAHGCGTVQLFTKNSNQWNARGLALNPYDRATFYTGGARGYTDYPFSTPTMEGNP